ncbi:M14 family zinc carboxypeptidase [Ornithinimicrobium sp. Y1847]|uniref:M14 family zinc carboxypeptidase n=1 Tax=Ornithinimicrobium sp. Y1847 TaxID=3405419 RepID=UPI003B673E1F
MPQLQHQRARRSPRVRRGTTIAALGVSAALITTGFTLAPTPAAAPTTGPVRTAPGSPVHEPGYPRQTPLPEPAVDEGDASLRLGVAAYHDLAPRLNAAMASSDRVSAEVIGTSQEGRQLVLVTLTAPESQAEVRQQTMMRDRLRQQPSQAAGDRGLARKYKLPVFLNANIHGNEWEGTDAALRLIEDYASSTDPAVADLLKRTRIFVVVSMNPDGRVDNTRRNAAGFDLNRDFVTASQPETIAVRDALIRTQPVLMLDLHGYVNGTLIEPTTQPHGENYEWDLFIKHAYPNALGMEQAILDLGYDSADGVEPPEIPLRDWDEGWDGWPPIFTPQYAALNGAVTHTIEIPLRVNNRDYSLPEDELRRRAEINTDIAHASMAASLAYVGENRADLLADQIEIFRRGVTGEPQTPAQVGLFDVVGPQDIYTTEVARAYVIPVDDGQRSLPAAARLVDHLVDNGVEVTRLSKAAWIGGVSYPEGTYVVDLHQARRAMAATLLADGSDISDRVDAMYDISGWSLALLWGANVVEVPAGSEVKIVGTSVTQADPTGMVASSDSGWVLSLLDAADVRVLTALLEQGVGVRLLEDGDVYLPVSAAALVGELARAEGVTLRAAPAGVGDGAAEVSSLRVGVAGTAEERWAFGEMGIEVQPVSSAALNEGLDLSDLDALYVSSGLAWRDLDEQAQAEVRAFVDEGGGVVARGSVGVAVNDALDLLEVETVAGRSDANGVVRVVNTDGAIAGGAPDTSFVYSPRWFTELGDDVQVEQSFGAVPLVSGHWRADAQGRGGPGAAAGQPVMVSGATEVGSRAVLLGTEPLFRAHPKGEYATVARALLWAAQGERD